MSRARLVHDRRGVVMVEFLLCFVPIFLLFLAILQLSLLTVGKLVVRHAASRGVRAAIVVLEDDPAHYDEQEIGVIADAPDRKAGRFERALASALEQEAEAPVALGGPRMADIRRAVHTPLLAIAPSIGFSDLSGSTTAEGAIGDGAARRLLTGFATIPVLTATTLPRAPGSRELHRERVVDGALITVRVTHAMPCLVPIVGRLMCDPLPWSETLRKLKARLPGAQPDGRAAMLEELQLAPGAAGQRLVALAGVPVALLQAEASLPAQRASYPFHEEPER